MPPISKTECGVPGRCAPRSERSGCGVEPELPKRLGRMNSDANAGLLEARFPRRKIVAPKIRNLPTGARGIFAAHRVSGFRSPNCRAPVQAALMERAVQKPVFCEKLFAYWE